MRNYYFSLPHPLCHLHSLVTEKTLSVKVLLALHPGVAVPRAWVFWDRLLLKSLFYWLLSCCIILGESLNLSAYLLRTWDNETHFRGVCGKTEAGDHVYVSRTASGISPISADYFFCQLSSPTWLCSWGLAWLTSVATCHMLRWIMVSCMSSFLH